MMVMASIPTDNQDNEDNDKDQDDDIIDGGVIPIEAAADGTINNMIGNDDTVQIPRRGVNLLRQGRRMRVLRRILIIGLPGGEIRLRGLDFLFYVRGRRDGESRRGLIGFGLTMDSRGGRSIEIGMSIGTHGRLIAQFEIFLFLPIVLIDSLHSVFLILFFFIFFSVQKENIVHGRRGGSLFTEPRSCSS